MPNILIRDVPEEVLTRLKSQAESEGRSLQKELLAILLTAAEGGRADPLQAAMIIRETLSGPDRQYSDSVKLIREDRSR